MQDLKISIVQTSLYWEDKEKNLVEITKKIYSEIKETDLIILPEMFTTGFSMNPSSLAEKHLDLTFRWMQEIACEKSADVMGSFIVKDDNCFYNRLYWVSQDGSYDWYDKRHLFRMGNENQHFSYGRRRMIAHIKGWKVLPLICYDLRFPVWSANHYNQHYKEYEYDCIIYLANWPASRSHVWDLLLKARALENISYVAGINRIGTDGKMIEYSGNSKIISPRGNVISTILPNEERIETLSLSMSELQDFRKAFPVGLDFDDFTIF